MTNAVRGGTGEGRSAVATLQTKESALRRIEGEIQRLEDQIAKLDADIAKSYESDGNERARDRKEEEKLKKEEKVDEVKEKLTGAEEEVETAAVVVDEILARDYPAVLAMFPKVYEGVTHIFGQVMLTKGLDVTKWNLGTLMYLFKKDGPIQQFCLESSQVSKAFLAVGNTSSSKALTTKYQAVSSQTALLDQIRPITCRQKQRPSPALKDG